MLDVNRELRVDDEVAAHMHPTDGRRPESQDVQRRVLRRWQRDRDRLLARTRSDPEQIADWQLDRVRSVVETAFATHPFYHDLYRAAGYRSGDLVDWSDYHALPTVSKADIIDNADQFTWNRALSPEDVYSSRTSGSSGQVLTILQDEATSSAGHVLYLRHFEQLLGTQRRPDEWVYEVYLAPQRYSSLDGRYPAFTLSPICPVDVAARHIRQIEPAVLWAFPSYLLRMADAVEDLSELGIRAVCTHSEGSTPAERRLLAERFGAPVMDEYSSEELYLIATQCRHGRYHVVEDNVRTDVLGDGDGGPGEIVATSLMNSYMPFIRYRQGDVIRFASQGTRCACGNRFAVLDQFLGRSDQFLRRHDGSVVAPDRVMAIYDATLLTGATGVAEFRVVQQQTGAIEILVRPTDEPASGYDAAVQTFCRALADEVADALCPIRPATVAVMPPGASYKRRLITSLFDPSGAGGPGPAPTDRSAADAEVVR